MDGSRRGFLSAAVTAAGATVAGGATAPNAAHGQEHQAIPSDSTLRVKSLESLLVEKGLVERSALDTLVDTFEHKVGPRNGARVVARAWTDPAYKRRAIEWMNMADWDANVTKSKTAAEMRTNVLSQDPLLGMEFTLNDRIATYFPVQPAAAPSR